MKALYLMILIVTTIEANADLGPAYVQAVCRVTTSNGKSYEGFIQLMVGGIHGLHQNGFYFYKDDHYRSPLFYNYDFQSLKKTDTWKGGVTRYHFGNSAPEAIRFYFMACIWDRNNYWLKEEKNEIKELSGKYLEIKETIRRKYLLLDTLPLFTELSSDLHIDYKNKKLKRTNILTKDIVSIEIVMEPNAQLLAELEKNRKILYAELAKPESSGDFQEPIWVHELVKDSEQLKRLQVEFKEWRYRQW